MNGRSPTRRAYLATVGAMIGTAGAGCLGQSGDCSAPTLPPPSEWREEISSELPRIIAHRGCAGQFPENTLYAFEQVSPYVGSIELDVRRCRSGEIVVFHDETLDRVTSCEGRIERTDYETLASCDVLCTERGVPRLADVFEAVPSDVEINVELKTDGIASDVADLVERADQRVLVSSFLPTALREMEDVDSSIPLALVTNDDLEYAFDRARDLGCSSIHPKYDLPDLSALVRKAHDADMQVNVWTIVADDTVSSLADLSVDGLIADRLDIF